MSDAVRFRRAPRALWRRVGSGYVATTMQDVEVHELLGGAAAVWDGLMATRSTTELVGELASIHRMEPEEIRGQVEEVLERLLELGLIEQVVEVGMELGEVVEIDA